MTTESAAEVTKSERDVWKSVFWILGLGGSVAMLYYEYMWSRFALNNAVTFSSWFWTGLGIATPWNLCFYLLGKLREGLKNGAVGREFYWEISAGIAMVMICAYWILATGIQRLTSLGALR